MKKIKFTAIGLVSICAGAEFLFVIIFSFVEQYKNHSYMGWVVAFSVATIVLWQLLLKMIEAENDVDIIRNKLNRDICRMTQDILKKMEAEAETEIVGRNNSEN